MTDNLLQRNRALYLAGKTTDATARLDLSIIARAQGIPAAPAGFFATTRRNLGNFTYVD